MRLEWGVCEFFPDQSRTTVWKPPFTFFSLDFAVMSRKTTKKHGIFCPFRTPKFLERSRKWPPKTKEIPEKQRSKNIEKT